MNTSAALMGSRDPAVCSLTSLTCLSLVKLSVMGGLRFYRVRHCAYRPHMSIAAADALQPLTQQHVGTDWRSRNSLERRRTTNHPRGCFVGVIFVVVLFQRLTSQHQLDFLLLLQFRQLANKTCSSPDQPFVSFSSKRCSDVFTLLLLLLDFGDVVVKRLCSSLI